MPRRGAETLPPALADARTSRSTLPRARSSPHVMRSERAPILPYPRPHRRRSLVAFHRAAGSSVALERRAEEMRRSAVHDAARQTGPRPARRSRGPHAGAVVEQKGGAAQTLRSESARRRIRPSSFAGKSALLAVKTGSGSYAFWRERLAGELRQSISPWTARGHRSVVPGRDAHAQPGTRACSGPSRARPRAGVTLYTLLLAAYRPSSADHWGSEINVGVPASGRTVPRFAGLVGYLVTA